jgi:glutaredoxin
MGVSLVEYDIERDPRKREEMITKSGSRGVPVLDIEGIIVRGYSEEEIRAAIERRRRE